MEEPETFWPEPGQHSNWTEKHLDNQSECLSNHIATPWHPITASLCDLD